MNIGPSVRDEVNAGDADYTPVFLSEIPSLLTSGALPVDVTLVQVSPPDEHGFCSFGVSVDVVKPAAESSRVVVAEVQRRAGEVRQRDELLLVGGSPKPQASSLKPQAGRFSGPYGATPGMGPSIWRISSTAR